MENEEKKLSKFSKNFVKFIGYWWITLSVIIAIWQLFDFVYDFQIPSPWDWIAIVGVIVFSLSIAVVLTCSFPFILDVIFNKQALEEKYYHISDEEKNQYFKSIIYSNLPYIKNDENLLDSILTACSKNDYDLAIKIGLNNSPLFYHLKNNYIRVLNGIITMYALEKSKESHMINEHTPKYHYVLCSVLINDLGWSLCNVSNNELSKINCFLYANNDIKKCVMSICKFDNNLSAERLGLENIKYARKLLRSQNMHPKLIAQAIRHLLNFKSCLEEEPDLVNKFTKAIKRINNEDDKCEMLGNLYFYFAEQKFLQQKETNTDADVIKHALKEIEEAKKYYLKIKDYSRLSKCYNIKGKLFLLQENIRAAEREFNNGLSEAYKIIRYDQVLENLYCLAKLVPADNGKNQYAREGLNVAQSLENEEFIEKFGLLYKPKQIILLRHGEATKNIESTINGEGKLTEFGREHITKISQKINEYLTKYKYEKVTIFGHSKQQVNETITILMSSIDKSKYMLDDVFSPTFMGELFEINESDPKHADDINKLKRWRAGLVHVLDLDIKDIEPPINDANSGYWDRAKKMYDLISQDDCSIVVCTTSIAILLTQYILNNSFDGKTYRHLDIPLGGIVHFIEDVSQQKETTYKLINKEENVNIDYRNL